MLDLAGGADAHVVVLPAASSESTTGQVYARLFRELGAAEASVVRFPRRETCADPDRLRPLERATGIFLTGGNQLRLTSILGGTPLARLIRRRNHEGAVVAGTSAGAAALSEHMIAYGHEGATPRAAMVSVAAGLGLIDRVVIDQHFRQRDRLGSLLTAIAYNPFLIGVGLDEDTAVCVDRDDVLRVVGSNAVTVVDPASVTHIATGYVAQGEPVAIHDLRLHVLVEGARYDLRTREAREARDGAESVPPDALEEMDRQVRGESNGETPPDGNGPRRGSAEDEDTRWRTSPPNDEDRLR